jgi:outer membrane lipase/esterase
MRMVSILCAAGLALAVLAVPARAGVISSVVAFGDRLIDDGNTTLMPSRPPQPPAPYAGGRYTNGPTPTEVLATRLGVPLHSYAIGGAQSGVGNIDVPVADCSAGPSAYCTGVQSQLGQFLAGGTVDPHALYVVMGGSNDFLALLASADPFGQFDSVASDVVNNLLGAVATLHGAGARQFLLPLLPDIGAAPAVADPTVSAAMRPVNAALSQAYMSLYALLGDPGLRFILFDTYAAQQALMPAFDNSADACLQPALGTVCDDPDRFFFWDDLHPTAAVSARLGDQLVQLVPEPGMLALLLAAMPLLARRRTIPLRCQARSSPC